MKKILILNWRCPKNPLSGGAEKVTLKHASYWVKRGLNVTWLTSNYKNGKKEETIDGVKIFRIGTPISIYFLAPFVYWFKWRGNFDLVIDEIHGIPFLSPLWAWKSKKLAYIHEVAQEIWDEMFPFPLNILGKIYEKIYFLFYKNISFLTGSDSTKNDLIAFGVKNKNIKVIPHGLFLKPLKKEAKKEEQLTLLFIGRLVKMKGVKSTIKIFAKIHQKFPNSKLWIVGAGGKKDYVKKLHHLVKKLQINDFVIFYGYVSEKKKIELYQKAHFLLHTSIREGFGLTIIEANSQGTPALALDSPGLRDIVKNGINGYLFSKNSVNNMVKKIVSIYNELIYKTLIKSSIEYSRMYDWKKITQDSLKILQNF